MSGVIAPPPSGAYFTDAEVDEMCAGLTQDAAKIRYLRGLGLRVDRKPNGRPLAWRPADEVEEAAAPTPLQPWPETPLGRWQAEQRRVRANEETLPLPLPWKPTKAERRAIELKIAEKRAALIRHHAAKRRACKLRRTPPWADLGVIKAIYVEARRLTRETGVEHHVDHEIPLQGELVSGLHVHTNLQIITGSENSRKKNRFEPC